MQTPALDGLFPSIEPHDQGYLPALEGHEIYFEQCGNPQGLPVVFLHGGPGSGCSARHRQLFNPHKTRVILFDQRGCGRSKSEHALAFNTTAHLIADIERLRQHLGIDRWLVVGGSWGGGLGLAYASAYRASCLGAVLRGVFLSRRSDLQWFFQDAQICMPDAWHALAQHVPTDHRHELSAYVWDLMLHGSDETAWPLAHAWQTWENALTQRRFTPVQPGQANSSEAKTLLSKYRLQSHYLKAHCFFPPEGLLSQVQTLHNMPLHLLHGRLDWICLPQAAWAVHQALPHSRLQWVDNAGHNPFEATFSHAMVQAIKDAVAPWI